MPKILLIADDTAVIRKSVFKILEPTGLFSQILQAKNGLEALDLLLKNDVDLLISDINMPVMDGYKLLGTLRNIEKYRSLPVIFLTSQSDSHHKVKGLQEGANDYVTKPFEPEELVARVKNLLTMKSLQSELDIKNKEMEAANRKLEQLSFTDETTGLWNRRYLWRRLTEEITKSERHQLIIAALMIDIDDFKKINDTYGHITGDLILAEIARILKNQCRSHDLVARYGGEEFVMLLHQTDLKGGVLTAERLVKAVENYPFTTEDKQPLNATVSIGVAAYPAPVVRNATDLIKQADQALYEAKRSGKNRVASSPEA